MRDVETNTVVAKSFAFAVRCVKLRKYLTKEKNEYEMSKQLLRCGTSIGANVKEALRGQSRPDFGTKMNISLKEASESEYWIELLQATEYLTPEQGENLLIDCRELIKLLTSIVKTTLTKE
ncbi:MAG: four helix bundle protein [Bacteroidaceae bacterium]|nr:four helix bundle protein [Bacteroidaceae bacterium]